MADPVSAGASVIAFVGLALSSAKVIHDVLSAVRDGPRNVQHLADEVKQLQDILERITQLQVDRIGSTDLAELASLSTRCKTDLAEFASKLGRLHLTQDDRRFGRVWRRLKTAFTEKDLERMRDAIRDYTAALNIRLTLLTTTQLSLSTTQSSQVLDLLRQLQAEVRGSLNSKDAEMCPSDVSPQAARSSIAQASDEVDANLEQAVDRLIQQVKDKECTVDSDDGEQLILDLQTLLDSAREKELSPTTAHLERATSTETPTNILKELKLASSLMLSAPSISINRTGSASTVRPTPGGFILQQDRKRKVIDMGCGTLTMTTNKRQRIYNRQDDSSNAEDRGAKDFIAQILFRSAKSNSLISISVSQRQLLHGSFSSIPKVLHGNIIPTDSYVFNLAANGRVEDLMALLTGRGATLHDRNPRGWTLLHASSLRCCEGL
jgi:hypothetical protein